MPKQINFFDSAESSTTPVIGNIDATSLVQYADDASYEAANAGSPIAGNIYFNTTLNLVRYYNGTDWQSVLDEDGTQTLENKTIDGTDATGTNTVLTDADDVSYDNTSSGMAAANVQAAVDEVEARVEQNESDITNLTNDLNNAEDEIVDLRTLTGTATNDEDLGTFTGTTIPDAQTIKAALQILETAIESLGSPLQFQGTWDANANSPTLSDGTGTQGYFYIVDTAGTTSLDGISDWQVNDWAIFDGTVWRKIDNSELVTSVNGQTGNVTIGVNDLDGLAGSNGARRELRRDSGNTAWEIYNPHNSTNDSTSGSNATIGGVGAKVVYLTSGSLVSIDGVPEGYDNQTFILVNKTGVPVTINNDTGSTAEDRILTGTGGPIDLDVDAGIPFVYDGGSSRWRLSAGTGGGEGGLSGVITGNDSTADSTTGDWTEYADTAQLVPEDGTGGSPNISLDRTTTTGEIIQGKATFEITKGAFDRQGEGVSLDIDIANEKWVAGKRNKIALSYEASSNFDYGDPSDPVASPSDIGVYLYDVTNSKLLIPDEPNLWGTGYYESGVFIPSDCEDVRVILHIQTDNALAWDFRFDRVQLDIFPNVFTTNKNTVQTKTLSTDVTSTTTMSDLTFDNLKIGKYYKAMLQVAHQSQTSVGTSTATIVHDTNTLAESRYDSTSTDNNGRMTSSIEVIFKATDTEVTFDAVADANDLILGDGTQGETFAQLEELNNYTDIEVAAASGLNSKAIMRAYKNGGTVSTDVAIASWTTVEEDSLNGFNPTTGVYTAQSPGDYYVCATLQVTAADTEGIRIYKNGSQYQGSATFASQVTKSVFGILPNIKYGDTIDIRNSDGGTVASNDVGTTFMIFKLGSENQPYAPKVCYIKDVKSNGTSGGTFTSGAWQTRDLNTLEGDQSFISLASDQFTLDPGTYRIESYAPAVASGTLEVGQHKSKLYNITDAENVLIGSNAQAQANNSSATVVKSDSIIQGEFTITESKTFEIQHRCSVTATSTGFGLANSFGVDEVYTQVKITKVR